MKRDNSTDRRKKQKLESNSNQIKLDLTEYYRPDPVYYKNPLTFSRANEFNNGKRSKPLDLLTDNIGLENKDEDYSCVIHWFRDDLRVNDNVALFHAIKQSVNKPIHAMYIINENDWIAHLESGWKLKFQLEALTSLNLELAKRSIKLHVKHFNPTTPSLSNSKEFSEWFVGAINEIDCSTNRLITANLQYETDELYRDARLLKSPSYKFQLYHDKCVVNPGILKTGKGSQYTVFTPWYKKWVAYLEENKSNRRVVPDYSLPRSPFAEIKASLIEYQLPDKFTSYLPDDFHVPPADEQTAMKSLDEFLDKKGNLYNDNKDALHIKGTSRLSAYVTSGIISTRSIVQRTYHANDNKLMNKDIKKNNSLETFIKEVAWRDFYKHVICQWPFLSMDIPFKFETLNINWENDTTHFEQWCFGKTGFPIVDAIMVQLLKTGYINNRARMIVASFLSKNLLIDWRWGERWFRKHLIDYDVASNIGGWGFCSSTGIDCQPYFRVFNMTLQSQKYDPNGRFIRHWLDLNDEVDVHVPNPDAVVDLKETRDRALERFREIM